MPTGNKGIRSNGSGITRRDFLKAGAAGAAGLMAGSQLASANAGTNMQTERPNILFINVDQLSMESLGVHGCPHVRTPNIDRLASRGVTFRESHTADPICCPARASWLTGRMSCEHAVVFNNTPIVEDMPDVGRWLTDRGYETIHTGKWHVPGRRIWDSFQHVYGEHWVGEYADESVARAGEAHLRNRASDKPFFMVVGFLQPHDICYWVGQNRDASDKLRYPEIADELPPLPPNFDYDFPEPQLAKQQGSHQIGVKRPPPWAEWTDEQWRYYLWAYYRHVEMVDAVVGHVFDALEDTGYADNTVVIFASDHGEGQARHKKVAKEFLYEECVKVPLIISWPGRIPEGVQDTDHLVSGVDLVPTICDYAGVEPPPDQRGYSLRPALEGRATEWREFVPAECFITGRMIRTRRFKYITYRGDPVEQLFDIENDPWELRNLATDPQYAGEMERHRRILADWEAQLKPAPPEETYRKPGKGKK
ncbi:MAG: sulfatase family protein [Planctomycetota bacterium]